MKKNKGITLISLVITIIIMLIISGTIIVQGINNFKIQNMNKLYNDLELLNDKITIYYAKYGTIPVKGEFTGSQDFKTEKNPNDNEIYYVIDLDKLENLTLNNRIANEGDDVYIINDETHTIYYPKGLEIDGIIYYCIDNNYTQIN